MASAELGAKVGRQLVEVVGLPRTVMDCGDVIYRSTLPRQDGQPDLLQSGSSTFEILETAFKKENVSLVMREQYVEKVIARLFMYI
ncbi:serine/threonine-protein kinase STN7, chloroplastic-like [Triticum urartu]|uniref:serine/threonine-protein kinase STN7, chloroplastic-like n=1 Tax=Triticum urartu TaxID=4572 RepID=UPI002043061A|nr:serine/threonine-protein kinase STN7, chloroplastic-like [Triticum urartu]